MPYFGYNYNVSTNRAVILNPAAGIDVWLTMVRRGDEVTASTGICRNILTRNAVTGPTAGGNSSTMSTRTRAKSTTLDHGASTNPQQGSDVLYTCVGALDSCNEWWHPPRPWATMRCSTDDGTNWMIQWQASNASTIGPLGIYWVEGTPLPWIFDARRRPRRSWLWMYRNVAQRTNKLVGNNYTRRIDNYWCAEAQLGNGGHTIARALQLTDYSGIEYDDADTPDSITTPSVLETTDFVESTVVGSVSSVALAETGQFVDGNAPAGVTSITQQEEHDIPDSSEVDGVTSLSITDIAAYVDSATPNCITTPSLTDEHDIPDSGEADGVTSLSITDVSAYVDNFELDGVTTLSVQEGSGSSNTDSDTCDSTTTITYTEVAAYVDADTLQSETSISTVDVADFVDAKTVLGQTSALLTDIYETVDSAICASVTSLSLNEILSHFYTDLDTCFSMTQPSMVEFASHLDSATVRGLTTLIYTYQYVSFDSDTAEGITTVSSVDIYHQSITFDTATIISITTLPHEIEITKEIEFAIVSTKPRWAIETGVRWSTPTTKFKRWTESNGRRWESARTFKRWNG